MSSSSAVVTPGRTCYLIASITRRTTHPTVRMHSNSSTVLIDISSPHPPTRMNHYTVCTEHPSERVSRLLHRSHQVQTACEFPVPALAPEHADGESAHHARWTDANLVNRRRILPSNDHDVPHGFDGESAA